MHGCKLLLLVYIAKNHVHVQAVLTDVMASTCDAAAPSLKMEVGLRVKMLWCYVHYNLVKPSLKRKREL